MNNGRHEFYTVRGYSLLNGNNTLTPSTEDYLEMSYRLAAKNGYTRIGDLAQALNVQPPSASKMIQKLTELGYVEYQKYGIIQLTEQGYNLGEYLLKRHTTIETFLTVIGVTGDILEQTEKIEHSISRETFIKIEQLVRFLEKNKDWHHYNKDKY